ncbi:hypothetical protein ACFC1R_37610 [Kitasatospora sp. NPDC056138]|uniref:hypothetical protein n=1 Tax=Kitasatospora sp. NPDC056138 TaxID=3345724 RepID=UPI0035DB5CCD
MCDLRWPGGRREWHPADLIDLQQRWYLAEAAWADHPTEETKEAFAAVSAELYSHPYWGTVDNRHKAVVAVRKAARAAA